MAKVIEVERESEIAWLRVSNGKANAISLQVVEELSAALTQAEEDDQTRAVVIQGAEGFLSGGFDLEVMKSSPQAAGELVTAGGALFKRLYGSPVPVVIACTGHAVAAGALLLLAADYSVGVEGKFKIGLIETEVGMVLPKWAVQLAGERLPRSFLARSTVGAEMYQPSAARTAGFLDQVVEPNKLGEVVRAEAQRWASLPAGAYRGQVEVNRGSFLKAMQQSLDADAQAVFEINQ